MSSVIHPALGDAKQPRDTNVRNLHDLQRNLLNELNKSKGLRNPVGQTAAQRVSDNTDILTQLETLVEVVESSQGVIDALVGRIKNYEEVIYDLKAKLCEEAAQKEAAYQQAARAQIEIRTQKDRADEAEARAKASEEAVRSMEEREVAIRGRLSRLTSVVKNLAAVSETKTPGLALAS
jgi:chromosome segregation ATPase